jgi:hypothetical protein
MKSMKLSKAGKSTMLGEPKMDAPEYPYGLRISLDGESMKKLAMPEGCKVGDKLPMMAMVEVVSMSEHQGEGDKEPRRSLDLQITDMEMGGPEGTDKASRLYAKK